MTGRNIILILAFIFLSQFCRASSPGRFYHIDHSKGLTNLIINSIVQDKDGFIWIGTEEGLYRYDGYEFKTFRHENGNEFSLSGNQIHHLFVDSQSRLWVSTSNGINIYNAEKEVFFRIMEDKTDSTALANRLVEVVFEDSKKNIWIGHFDGYSLVTNPNDAPKDFILRSHRFIPRSTVRNWISTIAEDVDGNIWFGSTFRGIYCLNASTGKIKNYFDLDRMGNDFKILKMIRGADGTMLFASFNNGGVHYYNKEIDAIKKTPKEKKLDYDGLSDIYLDGNNRLWLATNKALVLINDKNQAQHFYHNPLDDRTVVSNSIRCLYEDNTGVIWIGTEGKGVDIYYQPSVSIQNITKKHFAEMPDNKIMHLQYLDNKLYFTSRYSGLYSFEKEQINKVGDESSIILYQGFPSYYKNNSTLNIEALVKEEYGFQQKHTHKYGFNKTGLFSYRSNDTLYQLDRNQKIISSIKIDSLNGKINAGRIIFSKHLDENRLVFLLPNGLFEFNLLSGKAKSFFELNQTNNKYDLNRMCFNEQGKAYVVAVHIIYEIDLKSGTLLNTFNEDAAWGEKIYSIISDSKGDLWFSTNLGVGYLQMTSMKFHLFNKSDGVIAYTFSSGITKSDSDEVFFGTGSGIIKIDNSIFNPNENIPEIAFTGFQLFNKEVPVIKIGDEDLDRFALPAVVNEMEEIVLSHKQNFLSIEYVALNYISSAKNKYKYYLEGLEEAWNHVGSNRIATYNGLPPGEYVFKVTGTNNDGVWNENPREIKIIITPPFWQTWGFRIGLVLFLILGVYLFFVYRLRRIHKKKKILEKLVRQRTAEIEQQKEELATQADNLQEINALLRENQEEIQAQSEELFEANSELQKLNSTKDKFFSIIAHDLKNPFQAITGFSEVLMKDFDKLDKNKATEFIGFILKSSKTASSLLENLLEWARSQTGRIQFRPELTNLHEIAQNTVGLLKLNAENKSIQLLNEVPEKISAYVDKNMVTTVLRNLVNNAIKFTPKEGVVSVKGKKNGNSVQIVVQDTGVGMDDKTINKLFRIDSQISTSGTSGEPGTGLGLIICNEFIQQNAGVINVESIPGQGSKFIILFPSGKDKKVEPLVHEEVTKGQESEELTIESQIISPQKGAVMDWKNSNKDEKPLILIAEDTIEIRAGIKAYIEGDFRVVEAVDGSEGLGFAFDLIPDLIISDWMMPEMDGIEFCRKIKTDDRTSHIPLIMLTAKSTPSNKIEGFETGADEYMTKPFDYKVLAVRIKNLIDTRIALQKKYSVHADKKDKKLKISTIDETFMQRLNQLLEEKHDNSELHINDLSEEMGMGRSQFYRKLNALTGQSPVVYLRNFRLQKAAYLLKNSKKTVSEIMYSVGFNNSSYFARCFREVYSCSPSEYNS